MITHFLDVIKKKTTLTKRRSRKWRSVREAFVAQNPTCAVCGTRKKIEIHHKKPFYLYPELELSYNNLVSLCQRHHYTFGHLCDYRSYNADVAYDAYVFRKKIKERVYE